MILRYSVYGNADDCINEIRVSLSNYPQKIYTS